MIEDNYEGPLPRPLFGALVNNYLTSLQSLVKFDCEVTPVFDNEEFGRNMYRRTLSFIIALASRQIFPERRLVICHSLGYCFYYYFDGLDSVPVEDCEKLKARVKEIVDEDLPIVERSVLKEQAIKWFKSQNMKQSVSFLKNLNKPECKVTQCGKFMDLLYEPLLYRTGLLKVFDIIPYERGLVVLYPSMSKPELLPEFTPLPHLYREYEERRKLEGVYNVRCIGELNKLTRHNLLTNMILTAEAIHDRKIGELIQSMSLIGATGVNSTIDAAVTPKASDSMRRVGIKNSPLFNDIPDVVESVPAPEKREVKLIMIAGPSSSGKTTFSMRMQDRLRSLGYECTRISTDDYFVDRDKTPLGPDGKYDFECPQAINLERFRSDMSKLLSPEYNGHTVQLPRFDFKAGKCISDGGCLVNVSDKAIVVCEGIHCLNPILTEGLDKSHVFTIYIAPLSAPNFIDSLLVSPTDVRLMRRIIRDARTRGFSAERTISSWNKVLAGEKAHILPYSGIADSIFNSSLEYEVLMLAASCRPLLQGVSSTSGYAYSKARELLRLTDLLLPPTRDTSNIPNVSLLREFIGGSWYEY